MQRSVSLLHSMVYLLMNTDERGKTVNVFSAWG
jgi:hypothetical protein